MNIDQVHPGTVVLHYKGGVYTILDVTNTKGKMDAEFPATVYYIGANGNRWSRPLNDFVGKNGLGQDRYTVLFDGTALI